MAENKYIRFDWAMKRLLRQKANFGILEGLLTTLLGMKIKIRQMLESESPWELSAVYLLATIQNDLRDKP